MIRFDLARFVDAALTLLQRDGRLPSTGLPKIEIADAKDPAHGDFACNFALVSSKALGKNPREVAELLRTALLETAPAGVFSAIEIAGPGFINFRLESSFVAGYADRVIALGPQGLAEAGRTDEPLRVNVEFVSVNPNGPITVGSGRGAAFGSTLATVLEKAGHEVHREYYINDAVNSTQMQAFADSVRAILMHQPIPENGYKGDYVVELANSLPLVLSNVDELRSRQKIELERGRLAKSDVYERVMNKVAQIGIVHDQFARIAEILTKEELQTLCELGMIHAQKTDLESFHVEFDTWFSEQSLHDDGRVEQEVAALIAKGAADELPIRHKLKLAKGGKIEDVEIEPQVNALVDEDDGPNLENPLPPTPSPQAERGSSEGDPQSTSDNPQSNTLWLRSTKFGDDQDRVLRRKDGRLTYIASDVAYHKDKFSRPAKADKLITVLGPDHHGYIQRLHAVLAALEMDIQTAAGSTEPLSEIDAKLYASPEERDACRAALAKAQRELEVVIFQIVRFVKDGKSAPMRKRDGNIYSLRDLLSEIGKNSAPNATLDEQMRIGRDVARFFYLMRSHDTHMDFDIDLATKQNDENPVFYVQYAHARICSVIAKAKEAGIEVPHPPAAERGSSENRLVHPKELALILKLCDLPYEIQRCAEDYGVHRLTTYAQDLARTYHAFYDACRVILPEDIELSQARIQLCEAAKVGLKATLDVLGVSAPERMDRAEAPPASPSPQ